MGNINIDDLVGKDPSWNYPAPDIMGNIDRQKKKQLLFELQKRMMEEQLSGMPVDRDYKRAMAEYQTSLAKEAMARIQELNDPTTKKIKTIGLEQNQDLFTRTKGREMLSPASDLIKSGRLGEGFHYLDNIYTELPENIKKLISNKEGTGFELTPEKLHTIVDSLPRERSIAELEREGIQQSGANTRAEISENKADARAAQSDKAAKDRTDTSDRRVTIQSMTSEMNTLTTNVEKAQRRLEEIYNPLNKTISIAAIERQLQESGEPQYKDKVFRKAEANRIYTSNFEKEQEEFKTNVKRLDTLRKNIDSLRKGRNVEDFETPSVSNRKPLPSGTNLSPGIHTHKNGSKIKVYGDGTYEEIK